MSRLVLRTGTIDLSTREVSRIDGRRLHLTPRERDLLRYLAERDGEIVPREELLARVWGYADQVVSRTVDTTVRRLRAKIEDDPDSPEHLLTAHGSGYRLVSAPLPGSALPAADSDVLVGRNSELSELERLVAEPGAVTLVGPPGVGKTRLALEVGRARKDALLGGALFADLAQAQGAQIPVAVASSLGLTIPETAEALERRLSHALSARGPTLLILDNCEGGLSHVRAGIARWCRAAPELRVLATSREPIGYEQEHVFSVGPLSHQDAVELFVELSRRSKPSFRAADWQQTIDELVERLDRLPLAIALAASRSSALSPRHLLERLDDRFRLLATAQRDVDPRHRTLRAALDVSWDLLAVDERRVLTALSVFRGGFDAEAARAVAPCEDAEGTGTPSIESILPILQRLCQRSLLTRAGARFGGFAFVWDYAAERLAEDEDALRQALWRHVTCFAGRKRGTGESVTALLPDLANLVAATERATALGRGPEAASACLALQEVVERRGPYELARDHTIQVLALPDIPPQDRLLLLLRLGSMEERLGGDALGPTAEALSLAETLPDPDWRAMAVSGRASVLLHLGKLEEARPLIEGALPLARSHGRPQTLCSLLGQRATLARRRGELEIARTHLLEAAALAREHGAETELRYTLGNLAMLDYQAGRYAEAARGLLEVREACHRQQLLYGVMLASRSLAAIAIETGDDETARRELEQTLRLARVLGDPQTEISVDNGRGLVARMSGDWGSALGHHRRALALAERLDARVWVAIERGNVGEMLLYLGQLQEAEQMLLPSVAALQEMAYHEPLALLRIVLAELELSRGHLEEAEQLLSQVQQVAPRLRSEARAELLVRRGLLRLARGEDALPCLLEAERLAGNRRETRIHVERLRGRAASGALRAG